MFDNLDHYGNIGSCRVYGLFNEWGIIYVIDWRSGLTEMWMWEAGGGKMHWQQFGAAF